MDKVLQTGFIAGSVHDCDMPVGYVVMHEITVKGLGDYS